MYKLLIKKWGWIPKILEEICVRYYVYVCTNVSDISVFQRIMFSSSLMLSKNKMSMQLICILPLGRWGRDTGKIQTFSDNMQLPRLRSVHSEHACMLLSTARGICNILHAQRDGKMAKGKGKSQIALWGRMLLLGKSSKRKFHRQLCCFFKLTLVCLSGFFQTHPCIFMVFKIFRE